MHQIVDRYKKKKEAKTDKDKNNKKPSKAEQATKALKSIKFFYKTQEQNEFPAFAKDNEMLQADPRALYSLTKEELNYFLYYLSFCNFHLFIIIRILQPYHVIIY